MEVTLKQIKELREKTGVGINACKEALVESSGNIDKAVDLLRKQGIAKSTKRADKVASDGTIGVYVHANDKIAAMVELNCETDFSARSESFKEAAHDLAMQVAAMDPRYVDINSVPTEIIEKEKNIYRESLVKEGKPENIVEKIIEGKLAKFYKENCLMEQNFIKDDSIIIRDYLNQIIAKIGEKIEIGKMYRISVG